MQLTRRALLTAAGGFVLAGCHPKRSRSPQPIVTDSGALATALAAERDLLAVYDVVIARLDAVAATGLVRARDRHAAHVAALASALGSPTASSTNGPLPTPSVRLRVSLRTSVRSLQAAADAARDGSTAALLASIAAEHSADLSIEANA